MIQATKELHDELEEWIRIGISDDIFALANQRQQYKHYAKYWRDLQIDDATKSKIVLYQLKKELKKPWFFQRTFWNLLKLKIFSLLN